MDKIIRIFPFFIIGELFFPLFFKNLPYPFSTHYLWVIGWFILLFFFKITIFFSADLKYVYLLFIIYLIIALFHSKNEEAVGYLYDCLNLFLPLTILIYYRRTQNYNILFYLIIVALFFILITAIISIIGFSLFPESVRFNPSLMFDVQSAKAKAIFFERIGIGSYQYFYGCAYAIPVLVYLARNKNNKFVYYIFLSILFYAIIRSNYTTAFLLSLSGLILALIGFGRFKKNRFLIISIILIILFLPVSFYENALFFIAQKVEQGSKLQLRLLDLHKTFTGENVISHTNSRLDRIPYLFDQFKNSPIIGGGETTGHVYWFDIASLYGIIGILPFFFFLYNHIKTNLRLFNKNFKYYYLLAIFSLIINGFFKNVGGSLLFMMVFFIIPGINYLCSSK